MHNDHKFIFQVSEDLVDVYSKLFTRGNNKKAKSELDPKQNISLKNAIFLAFFSGASCVQLFMLMLFILVVSAQLEDTSYFLDEFYSLDSLFRLLFTISFLTFASGLCIMIWKDHDINYIHLLQVDFKDRMNHF